MFTEYTPKSEKKKTEGKAKIKKFIKQLSTRYHNLSNRFQRWRNDRKRMFIPL